MPVTNPRVAVKIPVMLLLACAALSIDAAEQQPAIAGSDITYNLPTDGPRAGQKWQLCRVNSRNCLSLDRRPMRPCLVSTPFCAGDPARIEQLVLAH